MSLINVENELVYTGPIPKLETHLIFLSTLVRERKHMQITASYNNLDKRRKISEGCLGTVGKGRVFLKNPTERLKDQNGNR